MLNRVADISADSSGTTVYASYDYLGAGSIIRTQRPEVTGGLELTHDPDSDATYKGMDRFGRVVDHTWRNSAGVASASNHAHWNGLRRVAQRQRLGPQANQCTWADA